MDQTHTIYSDEFLVWDFYSAKKNADNLFTEYTREKLIKAFRSHDWWQHSDIYGHNGLAGGWSCRKCKRSVKFPPVPLDKKTRERYFSDEWVLAFHFTYGCQKRFGGRITKCK